MEDRSAAVTVEDAMRLTHYSKRTIERYIEQGELELVNHQPGHLRKISRTSLDAFINAKGIRQFDEIDVLKRGMGDALLQIAGLRARVEDVERLVKRQFAEIEARFHFHTQRGRRERGSPPADPDGAISLVEFARRHKIQRYGKLRGLAEREPTLVTVILRPDAEIKLHKWMILPEQMGPLLKVLEERGIAYTPCAQCPHEERDQLPLAQ